MRSSPIPQQPHAPQFAGGLQFTAAVGTAHACPATLPSCHPASSARHHHPSASTVCVSRGASTTRNVPPVSTLLESADRPSPFPPPPPPPPAPETRSYELQAERELRRSITRLQGRAARLGDRSPYHGRSLCTVASSHLCRVECGGETGMD